MSFAWTEDNTKFAIKLWGDCRTAAEIARELGGGVTRNAVIGKLNRMGFNQHHRDKAGIPKQRPSRAKAEPRIRKPSPPRLLERAPKPRTDYRIVQPKSVVMRDVEAIEMVMPPPPPGERIGVMELRPEHCRFPLGDPRSSSFTFCGSKRQSGKPYCAGHLSLTYYKRT